MPAIPALLLHDGVASMLRLYGPEDLHELIAEADPDRRFTWEITSASVPGVPVGGLGTLSGLPRSHARPS